MKKKTVAIVFGGMSSEYKVSLQSAYAVASNLNLKKVTPVFVGITKEGEWFRFHGTSQQIKDDTWSASDCCTPAFISPCRKHAGLLEKRKDGTILTALDAVFPVLHGPMGEDGTIQGLLELAGIPIVGCGTLASAVCMNKDIAHKIVSTLGVQVPKSRVFARETPLQTIQSQAQTLGYPLFVKPLRAGSSFGISKVESLQELPQAIKHAHEHCGEVLIEEGIDGFEVGCAVLGDKSVRTGEVDEVELADGFFDFNEKYNLFTSKIHVPARVGKEQAQKIKEAAIKIYRALGCKGFARVDLFVKADGTLVFNEVNTIPGFTPHSRYPNMMKQAGIGFAELVDNLINREVNHE